MNLSVKIIAALLIISAGISTFYTAQIAAEYSEITEALTMFGAETEYDIESVTSGYLYVNITFENPSRLPIHIYEIDYAFYIYNSSTDSFKRYGVSAGGGLDIIVEPESNKTRTFRILLENKDAAKDILYLWHHEKPFILHEYMEIYYQVDDYEYRSKYVYGIPHYECNTCGGGPFG